MKYIIYEIFSGVGLCNQIFSLETSIYLANILNRKLILIIKNPLAHCGKASWNYGYLLNFFESDYLRYLPHGIEVYYKDVPDNINKIINEKAFKINCPRLSSCVFVDVELNTPSNQKDIEDFCHRREKFFFDKKSYEEHEYLFFDKSNASRCLYNFYTTYENMNLLYNICLSFKFKQLYYDIANSIYNNLNINSSNNLLIFTHLRFGDYNKKDDFLNRSNDFMIKNLTEYYKCHKTNMITPVIYFLIDNKKNTTFLNSMKSFNYRYIDQSVNNVYDNFMKRNEMTFKNVNHVKDSAVVNAIIEMILASKADDFIGYVSSTFSNYIQYLRYIQDKSYYNYSNLQNKNHRRCRLQQTCESNYDWIRLGFSGGHPVSWHYFFNPFPNKKFDVYFCSEGKSDGFGSQLQACFSLIAYCEYKNFKYVHRPFDRMHHNDENLDNFPSIMNEFINFESEFGSINSLSNFQKSKLHKFKEGYLVHGSYYPEFFYTTDVIDKIKKCYYSTPKPDLSTSYLPNTYNVALHIRRGDVGSNNKHLSRYTSNDDYINLLKKHKLPNNVVLHIFSQGKPEDFKNIINEYPKIVLHLDENIRITFHSLVKADLLILSKSSFSYSAALLNENIVDATIIKSWWHKPLKKWIIS